MLERVWEYKFVQLLWRTVWRFLKKTKSRVTQAPTPGRIQIKLIQEDTCTPLSTAALFTTVKTPRRPKVDG